MAVPRRIVVVAPNALPVVRGERGPIGGLETFAWSLARGLAAGGIETALLVRAVQRPDAERVEGVRLLVDVEPLRDVRRNVSDRVAFGSGFPWVSIRRWSAALAWQIPTLAVARCLGRRAPLSERLRALIVKAAPDVVIALGVSSESAAVLSAARQIGARGVLWLRSNADLDPRWTADPGFRNAYGVTSTDANKCLTEASQIIAQTDSQNALLRELTSREAVVVRNPVDLEMFTPAADVFRREGVLWIGRYDRFHKRPLLAIEIAKRCPEIPFTLVINKGDDSVADEIRRAQPGNVTLLDSVPRPEMPAQFSRARVFLSTGSLEHEGFPNVLLEAAASGVPIVSLEDFDGFLGASRAGLVANGDLDIAAAAIRRLATDEAEWRKHSRAGRAYVESHHSVQAMLEALRPWLEVNDRGPVDFAR